MAKAKKKSRHGKFKYLIGLMIRSGGLNYRVSKHEGAPCVNILDEYVPVADLNGFMLYDEWLELQVSKKITFPRTMTEIKAGKDLPWIDRCPPPVALLSRQLGVSIEVLTKMIKKRDIALGVKPLVKRKAKKRNK